MKKIKSLLLAVAGITTAIAPVAAISCGRTDRTTSGVRANITPIADITRNTALTAETIQGKTPLSVVVVTDSGHVTDLSFNQSSYEGMMRYVDDIKELTGSEPKFAYSEPESNSYENTYNSLLGKYNIWILSGFTHGDAIKAYIQQNKDRLIKNNVKIIGTDFTIDPNELQGYGDFYGLDFKVAESAYIVGQAVAELMATEESYANKRKVTAFGGMPFHGVVDFIKGYYRGILDINKTQSDANKKVRPTQGKGLANDFSSVALNTAFESGKPMDSAIANAIASNPTVILPVAGPATGFTLDELEKKANTDHIGVIGVDTDQAKSRSKDSGKFYTSITKNIAQAVYDTILYITYGIDSKNIYSTKTAERSFSIRGSFKQGWVGYAQSTLKDEAMKTKMNQLLAKYDAKFKELSEEDIDFISSDKLNKTDSATLSLPDLIQELTGEMLK
ncbi:MULTISPECIES: BMP family ABC transporter substrate-binding protein [unclassified Mycoplasma]|uniref:BMP family ABC transporter substrate-binding protein n=1 Tax=unclassified Mycoplasma TaxID=2683645 RepID=UPI002B1DD32B|nr:MULTISPECIES: BMP family ABC transporter substrate-binding protein [unclassified Mycoplasma]MEA4162355.1 BMP family ABC transporter substrate-binding protein [Mycoplasma sp. 4404]MEA4276445.1 BMP family ABC transporter substrate-binding protein [Mycoplasma sp. 21DD0573]